MEAQAQQEQGSVAKLDSGGRPSNRGPEAGDQPTSPQALQDLPPAPWTTIKLLQTFSQPIEDVQIDRVVELICADGSLSADLLRRANSAMYGLPSRISSLRHAAVIMGLAKVRTLALTVGLKAYLNTSGRQEELRRCWHHSLGCAFLAEELAHAWQIQPDKAYTAGLLHDVGRLVLLVHHPLEYGDLLSADVENGLNLLDQERELFGIDHCEAGAWLSRQWSFPNELSDVIREHHGPREDRDFDMARLIHGSCRLAGSFGFTATAGGEPEDARQIVAAMPEEVELLVGEDLDELCEVVEEKVRAMD